MTLTPPLAAPPRTRSTESYAQAASRVQATAGQRAGAYLIDVAVIAAIAMAVWLLSGSLLLTVVAVLELWAIGWVWEGHTGATVGNLICGIRTVRRGTEVTVGARGLLLRSLLMGAAHIIPILLPVGLAAAGALDGVAGARMIDVRKARLAPAGAGRAPSLEARVTGSSAPGPVDAARALITNTPLSRVPAAGAVPAAAAAAVPAAAPQLPQPPQLPDAGTVPIFELSDGTVIRASGLGFIGRAPRAPESVPDAILVRVPDGARSLSRTHAAFGIEDGDFWVQDLGSANGAAVRHLGGGVTDLTSQTPYFLVPGDVLVLGGDAELAYRRVMERAAPPAPVRQEVGGGPAPSVPAAPAEPAEPAAPAGHVAQPSAETMVAASAAPEPPAVDAAAALPARALVALQFQDGTTVPIHGIGYIGRAPSLPDGERPDAMLIAVPDGDRSVSRTHGRFGIVGDQTWFEDLGSGNGSMLRTGDGRSGPMTPHQRFGLVPGMVLQLGDCVIRIVTD